MARPTAGDVTALVRQLADDVDQGAGLVLVDTDQFVIMSSVQRTLFAELVKRGRQSANSYATKTITSADSKINWAVPSGQTLPDDFVIPLKLWEKLSGAADDTYIPMSNRPERLPDVQSGEALRYWSWEDDPGSPGTPCIRFVAPTTTRVVRIQYARQPPAITAAIEPLYIPGSIDALASGVLAAASARRGDEAATSYFGGLHAMHKDLLLEVHNQHEQRRPRQRRPYGMGRGVYR